MVITDLEFIAHQAKEQRDDYDAFRYYVEDDSRSDEELDKLISQLAAPIIEEIDCTQCANCCQRLNVYVTPEDADRLAKGLHISLAEVKDQYFDQFRAGAVDEWGVVTRSPCPFLKDKLCSVYESRPETCRSYPEFTPDFRWQLSNILAGAGTCPIIYNTIEVLKKSMNW